MSSARRSAIARQMLGGEGRLALDANDVWPTVADVLRATEQLLLYDP